MAPPPVPGSVERRKSVVTKTGRVTKPSAKKRAKDEIHDEDEDGALANGAEPKAKRIKFVQTPSLTRAPTLKIKNTGKIPYRPPGDGYDSEAEDREVDPVIEEQFILRMPPGEHADYIRRCIQERKIGLPRNQGGADISMRWVDDEGRRCMVTVQDQNYAAVLVDLPTITESMKTWDKKSFVKSADICQMLLVFDKVKNEEEVKRAKLPKAVEHGHRWPHGLTPPMHDCIHRRFRKRLSKLEIQNKEAEVDRLLRADREALATKWELVDERHELDDADGDDLENDYEEEYEEQDVEGDADGEMDDYFGDAVAEPEFVVDDALLEAEFEAQFSDAITGPGDALTPAVGSALEGATPMTAHTGTPAAHTDGSGAEDGDEDGDDDEESEEDEGDEGDMDDDDEDRHDRVAGVRNEIAKLKKQLADLEGQLARSVQPIMKRRIDQNIRNLKAELELKKSSIGDVDDD
jgi:transcription initiation factor TFIID subunit 7